ncbi:MCT-1_protein-like protein [Hexamita inflata]|uniref:MCT-1 protein-like protein n=1 Tax=Hexamita inflata TaxID=28002 RepID=A0AA86TU52_9EUKA|nr:MCT-1 protein-like protein [Hexamita inflata]
MFADFTSKSFSGAQKMRNKDQKAVVQQIIQNYPQLTQVMEELQSKTFTLCKMSNRCQFVIVEQTMMFWNYYDGQWLPTLRLLHQYPDLLPYVENDKGSCKFLLQGAQLMAPGVHAIAEQCVLNGIYPFRFSPDVEAMGYLKLVQTPKDIMKGGRSGCAGEIMMIIGDGLWETGDQVK